MKTLAMSLCGLVIFAAVGCNEFMTQESTETASTNKPSQSEERVVRKPVLGEVDETFSLNVPVESFALMQGEENTILIGINRGEDFRDEVAIKLSGLPNGVTLVTAEPAIQQGSNDATLVLKAANDATIGEFAVTVTGLTASSGVDITKEFTMNVSAK